MWLGGGGRGRDAFFGCGGCGCRRRRSQDFMLVQHKSMSREIYIHVYISTPPLKLLPKNLNMVASFA